MNLVEARAVADTALNEVTDAGRQRIAANILKEPRGNKGGYENMVLKPIREKLDKLADTLAQKRSDLEGLLRITGPAERYAPKYVKGAIPALESLKREVDDMLRRFEDVARASEG